VLFRLAVKLLLLQLQQWSVKTSVNNKSSSYLPRKTECTTRRTNWSSFCCQITAQCWSLTQPAHNSTVLNTNQTSLHTTAQCWSPTQPAQNSTVLIQMIKASSFYSQDPKFRKRWLLSRQSCLSLWVVRTDLFYFHAGLCTWWPNLGLVNTFNACLNRRLWTVFQQTRFGTPVLLLPTVASEAQCR